VAAPASVNGLTLRWLGGTSRLRRLCDLSGDVIVCDDDGAVVIHAESRRLVAEEAPSTSAWSLIVSRSRAAPSFGLYPAERRDQRRATRRKKASS
jgi:hypothetical protein